MAPLAPPVVLPARPFGRQGPGTGDGDQELVLEDLTREQVLDWRNRAAADCQLVFDHIERCGEASVQRLFTGRSRRQVRRGVPPHP
ncbi:hypothetical protein ACWD6P_09485 [Streptomyces sp. NPDC002446]